MYMLHLWDGDQFTPVTESSTIAEILTAQPWAGLESVRLRLGKWNRTFLQAEDVWEGVCQGRRAAEEADVPPKRPTSSCPSCSAWPFRATPGSLASCSAI